MNIIEELEKLKRHHNYCEDPWYSCPKNPDGCANEADGDDCNCGADKYNSKIDEIIQYLKENKNDIQ